MRVVIIGNGIIANLAALYLRKRLPQDALISIVGPETRGGMPVVGESTIEITAQFLENQLGLGEYLRKNHYPKYALTYYFKLKPDDPSDRCYSVQCNERDPNDLAPLAGWDDDMARPPSWQLNREVFDRDMKALVDETPGIDRVVGMVRSVEMNPSDEVHRLVVEKDAGSQEIECDWAVDASGRKQLLARHFGLVSKAKSAQRDVFWFRLSNFDRDLLTKIKALGPMPPEKGESYHYDRYFSTHHFMGKGNWIWLIPMRSESGEPLISVGLSSRPDVYAHKVASMDQFLEHVEKEHPVLTDFVKSGTVVDTNTLRNYRYVIDRAYSKDRWAIVGDAAFSPDPLFSNGLAFSTLQLEQVGEMIGRDCVGEHSAEYIEELEGIFWTPVLGSQNTIAEWYETMDDPVLCAARLHFIEVSYFYFILPLVVNRCHVDPERLKEWNFLRLNAGKPLKLPRKLLSMRERIRKITPDHFHYDGKEKVNLEALRYCDDIQDLRAQINNGSKLLGRYVDELLARWEATAKAA